MEVPESEKTDYYAQFVDSWVSARCSKCDGLGLIDDFTCSECCGFGKVLERSVQDESTHSFK